MDFTITKELLLALSKLSTGKSSGTDTVTAEMLKSGKDYLIDPLLRLVNYVFSTGIAPDVWNESLLTPIYKKGDRLDPGNYRGISIGSTVAKLFGKVLNNRLNRFIQDNRLENKFQIGFKAKSRTGDH